METVGSQFNAFHVCVLSACDLYVILYHYTLRRGYQKIRMRSGASRQMPDCWKASLAAAIRSRWRFGQAVVSPFPEAGRDHKARGEHGALQIDAKME